MQIQLMSQITTQLVVYQKFDTYTVNNMID